MKNYYFLYLEIITIFLYSCDSKTKETKIVDWKTLVCHTLIEELTDDHENQLCLFISDDVCSECVIKEYFNIKNHDINIIIIGLFRDKRNFISSTNQSYIKNKIFIARNQLYNDNTPNQPIYFIYSTKTKVISEIFYPAPCEEEKTLLYFQKIKGIINE